MICSKLFWINCCTFICFHRSVCLLTMASSAMITVPTTASRFALLQIDSDSDSDTSESGKATTKTGRDSSGKPRQGKAGAAGGKAAQGNDKKKDKKKKKKEQQQSEANEVNEWDEQPAALCLLHMCYFAVTWRKIRLFSRFTSPEAKLQRAGRGKQVVVCFWCACY